MKKKSFRGAFMTTAGRESLVSVPDFDRFYVADELSASSHVYGGEFQMIYGADDVDEACNVSEKKRRLSVDQVTALERDFEVENKLEPDRKAKLAHELGLQPRQVAIWFQNRRARWKTKKLERDYGQLKASFESLRAKYDAVQQLNDALRVEIDEMKAKLNEDNTGVVVSVKGESYTCDEACNLFSDEQPPTLPWFSPDQWSLQHEEC